MISNTKLTSRIKELVDKFNYITRIQGQIQIEAFKEITKKSGDKTFLLKILLNDDSTTIRVLIWGMSAIECLKIISNSATVVISNVVVKQNKYTNEKELVFTKNSTLEIVG
jgi:aspartyl/asparaginyl-tRNA synthetase